MLEILDTAKGGIDMNLLGFCSPDRIYYLDSCPTGLSGYSNQGFAWRFRIPDDLLFRTSNNLLEFLVAIITLWIDIVGGRLSPRDCALLMTDSTTTKGWMKKSNFSKTGNDPIQALTCINAAWKKRKYFWMQTWRDIASGLWGREIMSRTLSQESGKGLTKVLPQFCAPSSQIRCQTISRYYQYPARSVAGWFHCCSDCPWASGYRRNTQRQSLSMATLDNVLQVR